MKWVGRVARECEGNVGVGEDQSGGLKNPSHLSSHIRTPEPLHEKRGLYRYSTLILCACIMLLIYVLLEWVMLVSQPLGGPGRIVEIDGSKSGKRKYNRVADRSAETLIPLKKKWIFPGTTAMSDCCKACRHLNGQGYQHLQVNHSINFVDSETGSPTNTIESVWRHIKPFLHSYNRQLKES